jgi:antitoxin (DNA-binding transcriptional repressor) of toxin-antitoxin stability system
MKVVSESTLRSRITELFREIEASGEELLVANNGELVLKIISYRREHVENNSYTQEGVKGL